MVDFTRSIWRSREDTHPHLRSKCTIMLKTGIHWWRKLLTWSQLFYVWMNRNSMLHLLCVCKNPALLSLDKCCMVCVCDDLTPWSIYKCYMMVVCNRWLVICLMMTKCIKSDFEYWKIISIFLKRERILWTGHNIYCNNSTRVRLWVFPLSIRMSYLIQKGSWPNVMHKWQSNLMICMWYLCI